MEPACTATVLQLTKGSKPLLLLPCRGICSGPPQQEAGGGLPAVCRALCKQRHSMCTCSAYTADPHEAKGCVGCLLHEYKERPTGSGKEVSGLRVSPCFGMASADDFLMSSNSSVRAISSSLAALPRVQVRASRAASCLPASSSHLGDSGRNTYAQQTLS